MNVLVDVVRVAQGKQYLRFDPTFQYQHDKAVEQQNAREMHMAYHDQQQETEWKAITLGGKRLVSSLLISSLLCCTPMQKQRALAGGSAPRPPGGFAARMKLGALPQTHILTLPCTFVYILSPFKTVWRRSANGEYGSEASSWFWGRGQLHSCGVAAPRSRGEAPSSILAEKPPRCLRAEPPAIVSYLPTLFLHCKCNFVFREEPGHLKFLK